MRPNAAILPCGARLHLQHGPIDLIIGAEGDRKAAFAAAQSRFETVLEELAGELPDLRRRLTGEVPRPVGGIACRMDSATRPFATDSFVTRMAAVAGSVADTILEAMTAAPLTRAYVNNGGDIALHLTEGASFTTAIAGHDGQDLGRLTIYHHDAVRGIATSGRHGRSFSLGIADSVTVLARSAARADVAATLIANAVDLPGHPAITRTPAHRLDDASDLGTLPVVTGCGALSSRDITSALDRGRARAHRFRQSDLITGAALMLQGQTGTLHMSQLSLLQRIPQDA